MTAVRKCCVVVAVAVGIFLLTQETDAQQYCNRTAYQAQPHTVYHSQMITYGYSCGLFGWIRCSGTRYQHNVRTTYRIQLFNTCCSGYGGSNCHALCSGVTSCQNGGTCIAPNTCACSAGWSGARCTTALCLGNSSCLNGGTCIAPNTCACAVGWSGARCTTALCSGATSCQNGGTCIAPNTCVCPAGLSGARCTAESLTATDKTTESDAQPAVGTIVGANIVGWLTLLTVVVLVVIILFYLYKKKQKKHTGHQHETESRINNASANGNADEKADFQGILSDPESAEVTD